MIFERSRKKFQDDSGKTAETCRLLKEKIDAADAIVIGAGAGLSTSAGFAYTGERFHKYFQDFIDAYGFQDMYSGGFYPFETLEEHWAYWSRYIYINRYMEIPKPVYSRLLELVKDKEYFVLTTNVDHCFQKAGFEKERLFYTQGDYGLFQCSVPCHEKTYENEEIVREMVKAQGYVFGENGEFVQPEGVTLKKEVPSDLVPRCPKCGKPMSMNLRSDDTFVEDEGWHLASRRYMDFLERHRDSNILFLEAGVGFNTPGIIKYSFWRMTREWIHASYACLNKGEAYVPEKIREKSVCIDGDIGEVLECL